VGLIFVAAKQGRLQVKMLDEFDIWLPYGLELHFFLSRSILVFIPDAVRDYPDSPRLGHPTPALDYIPAWYPGQAI